jgi:hypothetical protein
MRMRIIGCGLAVGSPPRVADPIIPIERMSVNGLDQLRQFAYCPEDFYRSVPPHRDTSGVIPAILKAPEPLEEDRDDGSGT